MVKAIRLVITHIFEAFHNRITELREILIIREFSYSGPSMAESCLLKNTELLGPKECCHAHVSPPLPTQGTALQTPL
jgi:hypothetical protein